MEKSRKPILHMAIIAMILLSTYFVGFVFLGSMSPSASAKSARASHDISHLENGDFLFEKLGRKDAWNTKVLIIKDWDNSLFVYLIPTEADKVPLPERWWGWAAFGVYCTDFGPQQDESKKILRSGFVTCKDEPPEEGNFDYWQWAYSGVSKNKWIANLYQPKYELIENYVYINQ